MDGIEKIAEIKIKIKCEILGLKKSEENRIFKEYIENDYQNKYHVSIDAVLSALL